MIYVLDTSAISALMREDSRMVAWLSSLATEDRVTICTISRGEILFGLEKLAAGRRRNELEDKAARLFAVLPCESIPASAADRYAQLKATQRRAGLPLDENDLWIAATVLAIDATLVSRDKDFEAIQGLPLLSR